ncbi:MAG: NAD(P)H-dependent oxidoreductase subunit E [Veillonellaceae bacterium]|jgi:NADH:ubiquinone oxidoreductase subunit E|nr:NAD(P)H-dependent oxidoreductase subunit E [Veillonellaceae bacterium]
MNTLTIEICVGSACYLLGAQDLLEMIEGLPPAIRSQIDLRGASCLNACGKGPNIRINGELMSDVTPEKLLDIINNRCV